MAGVNEQSPKDSEDVGFCGEPFADNSELLSSLSPLLFCMKLFGLYFHRQDRRRRPTDDPELNPVSTTKAGTAWNKLRVYATVVLILIWINVVRNALMFTRSDHFGATFLLKIAVFTWFCLSAIIQTAFYFANHTGQLVVVLLTLPVTPDCVPGAHRVAVALTAWAWVTVISNGTFWVYSAFTADGKYDFYLAPLVTYIEVPDKKITIARLIGSAIHISPFPCSLFAHGITQVLVYVFYHQFGKVNKHFRRALGKRGEFSGDLSIFRRRHSLVDEEDLDFSI